MFNSIALDVAGPGVLAAAGLSLLCGGALATLLVALIEAGVMTWLKWGSFRQTLAPSFVMNLVTSIIGVVLMGFGLFWQITLAILVFGFILSTLVEAVLLMLWRHNAVRQNFSVALAANAVSYILLTAFAWFSGVLV
jgi:hypothetical protein